MDAPYSGGFAPGGRLFAVDGDQTIASPCGPPEIYNPLSGDSVPSIYPIVLLDRTIDPPDYVSVPIGTGFNVQDFAPSQAAICIEQEFQVAEAFYVPMPLNTLYDPTWSVGWGNTYVNLGNCFLVEESSLKGIGGGFVRFIRKFANLPPNRNEFESYNATYPPLNYGDSIRFGFSRIVNSRLFYEYFVFDNLDLLTGIPLYPGGHRINTAIPVSYPVLFEEFKGFKAVADAVKNNNLLDPDQPLDDASDNPDTGLFTTPSYLHYAAWRDLGAEIVAEASSFNRWMGNIFVRKTRFVLAL